MRHDRLCAHATCVLAHLPSSRQGPMDGRADLVGPWASPLATELSSPVSEPAPAEQRRLACVRTPRRLASSARVDLLCGPISCGAMTEEKRRKQLTRGADAECKPAQPRTRATGKSRLGLMKEHLDQCALVSVAAVTAAPGPSSTGVIRCSRKPLIAQIPPCFRHIQFCHADAWRLAR